MLTDTNILLRLEQVRHPQSRIVERALQRLAHQGMRIHIVPQNLFEFWVVATRPISNNGFGLTSAQAAVVLDRIKGTFKLLRDTPEIYDAWEDLVTRYRMVGKPAHDTRLVAAMKIHGLTAILTFDKTGFIRFPGIEVIDPAGV